MMIKKIILVFSFSSFTLLSQEFDETYLNSLPSDIRQDILDKGKLQSNNNEENYRSSEFSSSLNVDEDLLALKLRLEEDLQELERRLSDKDEKSILDNEELNLFGQDFFNTFQTSYMPINEPNPDSSYILDAGDSLAIQLIGQKNFIETFSVKGDGSINIPDIGKIIVAGLSLDEASSKIKSKVDLIFIGTQSFVSLNQIRDVNILVSGDANNPGIYTLSGNSNILHALNVAGGISEFGSFREINLIRNNKVIETLDIYDLLIDGNYIINKRLRSGDVVFVEARKKIVSIDGAVKRPAKYELKHDEYLGILLNYANGMKQTADLENIYLERVLDGSLKSIPLVNVSQLDTIESIDGDLIYIREHPFRVASISGAILKPGNYIMASGETLGDLISKAGGYTDTAYPFGIIYENNEAKLINEKAKNVLYAEFLDSIITLSQQNISQNFDMTSIIELTREIKNSSPNGRIVIDSSNDSGYDLVSIKDGDKIIIPEITNNVYVYGEVSSEGAVAYSPDQGVEYFISKSGGFKQFADNASIYILHPNGETERYFKKRNIFESQPKSITKIYPGSVIYVPRKIDNSATRRLAAQAYVSILGSIGIALASLSSLDNN